MAANWKAVVHRLRLHRKLLNQNNHQPNLPGYRRCEEILSENLTFYACARGPQLCSSFICPAFALLKSCGSVVVWGNPERGGDATKVQSQLYDIQQISCSSGAFCALRGDGHVVTWGAPDLGGRIPRLVREKLLAVKEVQASQGAFAALLYDGSVVSWGDVDYGGESQVYKEELQDVRALRSSFSLFAAICGDDRRVVTWGNCSVIAGHRTGLHPSLRNLADWLLGYRLGL
eukprot:s1459_g12.t2